MEWLLKAAHQGQVAAQHLVVTYYESEQHVLKSYMTAVKRYGKAAGNRHQQTQTRLEALRSKMVEEGRVEGEDDKMSKKRTR